MIRVNEVQKYHSNRYEAYWQGLFDCYRLCDLFLSKKCSEDTGG